MKLSNETGSAWEGLDQSVVTKYKERHLRANAINVPQLTRSQMNRISRQVSSSSSGLVYAYGSYGTAALGGGGGGGTGLSVGVATTPMQSTGESIADSLGDSGWVTTASNINAPSLGSVTAF